MEDEQVAMLTDTLDDHKAEVIRNSVGKFLLWIYSGFITSSLEGKRQLPNHMERKICYVSVCLNIS